MIDQFLVYKTVHVPTNRFYIGRHVTNDIDDGYLGSGTIISRLLKKHPKEDFNRQILHFASDAKTMLDLEESLISEVLDDPLCLNCCVGDPNSRGIIRHSAESKRRMSLARMGSVHSLESRKKMSDSKLGIRPSMNTKAKMSQYAKNRSVGHRVNHGASLKVKWQQNREEWINSFRTKRLPVSNETKLKHSISQSGKGNSRALRWKVESELGKIEIIQSIKTWCKEKDIKYTSLLYTEKSNKFYAGYKIKRETNHG